MKSGLRLVALGASLGLAGAQAVIAQGAPKAPETPETLANYDSGHARALAIVTLPARARLTVTSPAFRDGATMPFENTAFRGNHFPGLDWTRGPAGTRSYVVVMQGVLSGGDDGQLGTSIHFNLYNIPASITSLAPSTTAAPDGATFGSGLHNPYAGPHSHTLTAHAYHFQVFALDTQLPVEPKKTLVQVERDMKGHVLAAGELVGWAGMDPDSDEAKALRAGSPAPQPKAN